MCRPHPPPIDDGVNANLESDDDYESDFVAPYTPSDLVAIITDFYTFLTTLHFSAEDLKFPTTSSWPSIPSSCTFKSARAMKVLHQMPYFEDTSLARQLPHYEDTSLALLHYKSRLIDYRSLPPSYYDAGEDEYIYLNKMFEDSEGRPVDRHDVICFAEGRESGGRQMFLDVLTGEVTEDIIRCDILSPVDVVEYFEALKEEYRSLTLVPCTGRQVIEAKNVKEGGEVGRGEVMSQEGDFGTDVDVCWVRSVYRRHGWPDAFRREEAEREISEVMAEIDAGERGKDVGWYEWSDSTG